MSEVDDLRELDALIARTADWLSTLRSRRRQLKALISEERQERVYKLVEKGLSLSQVAAKTKLGRSTIRRCLELKIAGMAYEAAIEDGCYSLARREAKERELTDKLPSEFQS